MVFYLSLISDLEHDNFINLTRPLHEKELIKPILHLATLFARREAKTRLWGNMNGSYMFTGKKFAVNMYEPFLHFFCSPEQIRRVENQIYSNKWSISALLNVGSNLSEIDHNHL